MATIQQQYTETFVITICAECGMRFGVPEWWDKSKRETGEGFHCPNGHSLTFSQSENDRLKKELLQSQQRLDQEKARARDAVTAMGQAERRLSAQCGENTKLRNRISNGVCPCCHRSFANLRRHMATKHPEAKP